MYFDRWDAYGNEGVIDRVAVMRQRTGVEDDAVHPASRSVDSVDDRTLVVGLDRRHANSKSRRVLEPVSFKALQPAGAIRLGFTCTQEVQVGSVDDEYAHRVSQEGSAR